MASTETLLSAGEAGSESATRRAGDYLPQLDSLRTLAVLGVILSHWFQRVVDTYFPLGNAGVVLFFVLSGFLISRILLRERQRLELGEVRAAAALAQFYARRTLRIFPAFYLTLLIYWLMPSVDFQGKFAWYAFYGFNFLLYDSQSWAWPAVHLWTLAVEEQLYLLWPLVLLFTPIRHLRKTILAAIVLGPVSRGVLFWFSRGDATAGDMLHGMVPSCMDCFGLGAFLAYQRVFVDARFAFSGWAWRLLLGLSLGVALLYKDVWDRMDGIVLFRLSLSVLALALVNRASLGFAGPLGRLLENRVLVYLGSISYGIYLYHLFIPQLSRWLGVSTELHPLLAFPLQLALLVALAAASWHLFEAPINRLKHRLPGAPAMHRTVAAA